MAIYISISLIGAFLLGMMNGHDMRELQEGEENEERN